MLFAIDGDAGLPADEANALREAIVERAREQVANVVCVERKWMNLPAVVFDRMEAAHLAVSHLIELGHRRIAYVGARDDRLIGYRNTLLAHDLAFDEQYILDDRSSNTPEDGYRHARAFTRLCPKPTAVFACSDEVAIGLVGGLQEAGWRVPEDVALVSVDDIPFASYVRPRLTTVHVPTAEMGAYAVRMLHDWAAHPDQPPVSVVLPIQLMVRESCGASARMQEVERLQPSSSLVP